MNEAMKLTEHQIKEARNVYNLYWDSYMAGDIDTFTSTLDDNYEMIDTAEGEEWKCVSDCTSIWSESRAEG